MIRGNKYKLWSLVVLNIKKNYLYEEYLREHLQIFTKIFRRKQLSNIYQSNKPQKILNKCNKSVIY